MCGGCRTLLLAFALGWKRDELEAGPNLALVTIETLLADHLSANVYVRLTSPAIDELAAEGVLVRHAIVQRGETWPFLTSVPTSPYLHTHGVRNNVARIDPVAPLPPALHAAAYAPDPREGRALRPDAEAALGLSATAQGRYGSRIGCRFCAGRVSRSFLSARASSWRTRSRDSPSDWPICSSVCSSSPPRP